MPDRPQIPRTAALVGPAIDALVAARPTALPFINLDAGRWADLTTGCEAQVALFVRQLAREVKASRLRWANGDALTQWAASEARATRNAGATAAIGTAVLTRSTGPMAGGAFPKGFRFARKGAPTYVPPLPAAAYESEREVSVPAGATSVAIPIVASLAGSAANAPVMDGDVTAGGLSPLLMTDTPFDTAFGVASYDAGGGSDGEGDDDLRRQARALLSGNRGPTIGAIVAGALSGVGVHRIARTDVAQALAGDGTSGLLVPAAYTGVAIADASWASSTRWLGLVAQGIADDWQGVGGQVIVTGIVNARIRSGATILLRSGDDLFDTTAIDAAVLAAARAYFDDRPDWYTWTTRGLQAALSRAHPRILSCPQATVYALATNAVLSPPATSLRATELGLQVTHYELAVHGVTPIYQAAA